jgi:Family of unknown function (DUF5681)
MEVVRTGEGRWKPGQSGNPSGLPGRPLGSRQAFSQGFLRDLAKVWRDHGRETMIKTARDQPSVFFATCARLIPSDVKLTVEQTYTGLGPDEYAILRAIRDSLPEANSQSPQAVLEYVRDTLRAAQAIQKTPLLDAPKS